MYSINVHYERIFDMIFFLYLYKYLYLFLCFFFYQHFFILSGTRTAQSDGIASSAVLGLSTEDRRRPGIDPGSHQQII